MWIAGVAWRLTVAAQDSFVLVAVLLVQNTRMWQRWKHGI
jgi:hypothetical protein